MKSLKNNLIKIGIGASLLVAGYLVARYIQIPHFEVSKTIDISNVLSLIITAWIALAITIVFEKQNSDRRVEKDLIISRVGAIHSIADSLQIGSQSGSIHLAEANSSLKRITTALQAVFKIIDKSHFTISEDIKARLNHSLADIRTALTNTPGVTQDPTSLQDIPIAIRDGIVTYNKDRISQLEVKFDSLKDLLLELQIEINGK